MSLRVRLVLATAVVALVTLVSAEPVTYHALQSFLIGQVDRSLQAAHRPLQQMLDQGRPLSPDTVARQAPGMCVQLRCTGGQRLLNYPAYQDGGQPIAPQMPPSLASGLPPGHREAADHGGDPSPDDAHSEGRSPKPATYLTVGPDRRGGPQFRVLATKVHSGDQLIVAAHLGATNATLAHLVVIELSVTAAALLAAMLFGWWLVRAGLHPLRQLEQTALAIAGGDLARRVPEAHRPAELGRLARAFNTMVSRIEGAFAQREATEVELRRSEERLRRFVADASHELRTPLAAVSAYAELLEQAKEHPQDLARVMSGMRAETARMVVLVEDLLTLARLDEAPPLARAPLDLQALATGAVAAANAVGPSWPVRLAPGGPVRVVGDGHRLRQVLDNLLANVRGHTPQGTAALVRVSASGADAVVEVSDAGPGLAAGQAAKVFERFYSSGPFEVSVERWRWPRPVDRGRHRRRPGR